MSSSLRFNFENYAYLFCGCRIHLCYCLSSSQVLTLQSDTPHVYMYVKARCVYTTAPGCSSTKVPLPCESIMAAGPSHCY